jgi:putative FmdB family regulatory protein
VPTYDYRCDRCERTFEVRQRISEEPLATCERCGGPIRRLLSAAPFILKGGGWYVTDYPSEGRKKGMEAEKKSSGDAVPSSTSTTSGTDGAASSTAPSKESAASSKESTASSKGGGTSSDASAATAPKSPSTSSS